MDKDIVGGSLKSVPGIGSRDYDGHFAVILTGRLHGDFNVLAEGGASPPGAVYTRRWSVELSGDGNEIVLKVGATGGRNASKLVTIRTRQAP